MNRPSYRQKKRGILNSIIVMIILIIIAIILTNSAYKIFKKTTETKEYLKLLETNHASLLKRYDEVKNDLEYANSKTGLEKEIRTKFGLSLEGESAIFIIEEEKVEEKPIEKKSIMQKIKDFISF